MDIGIAGAGLAGRLLTWLLLREGHRVTLFDRDEGDGNRSAGYIAAAMLAPYSEAVGGETAVFEPGLQALKQWPRWLSTLRGDSGMEVSYQQRGSLVVAHGADREHLRWFFDRLRALPEVPDDRFRWLSPGELIDLEPELNQFSQGVYLPGEGCLDNRALYAALQRAIAALGGQWQIGQEVISVMPGQIGTAAGEHSFDQVLDCRGFGGKHQLPDFRGVRGEVLWVEAPEVGLSRPVRLMHPRYQLYIAPRPGHVYVIGATEIESESLAPVTVRSSLELLSALHSVHTGFAEARVLEARSHCRPAFMNNLPKIVRAPGLLRINGLYRHGYLLAPALISSALDLLSDKPPHPAITVEQEQVI